MKFIVFLSLLAISSFSQNISSERVWKIGDHKRAIYFDQGIFHHKVGDDSDRVIKNLRNSYVGSRGYERLVFDFSSPVISSVYGHVSADKKTLYLDLLNTKLGSSMGALVEPKWIKEVKIFDLEDGRISVEVITKVDAVFDVFYLSNPGRLVVDIKLKN